MTLNESIVEDAALVWFLLRSALLNYGGPVGEQSRVARTLTPALSHVERESSSEVVLVGRRREAIRLLNPAIPEEARATIKRYLRVQLERRQKP
jgi:hypothetical protein